MTAAPELRDPVVAALGLAEISRWFDNPGSLACHLLASFCHHGKPVKPGSATFDPRLWRARDGRDPLAALTELRETCRNWFPEAFRSDVRPFPENPSLQNALNGLVTLADWIGSDTRFFPYAEDDADRMPFARRQAAEALRQLGLIPGKARASMLSERSGFRSIAPPQYQPRPVQAACSELPDIPAGSLVVVESDTGSGKTEAALVRFVEMFRAGLVDGMYFALPTRAAAKQIHGRICEAVHRAFPVPDARPAVTLAVPGYLLVDDVEGRRLAPYSVLWDEERQAQWHYRGWAAEHPKRYLAGTVVVGTIDQVLLSSLQVKHAHMRATALRRHLLVVDEVHASDHYMSTLLGAVLDNHLKCGGHALLMSATLGTAVQSALLSPGTEPPSLDESVGLHYPLISHTGAAREHVERVAVQPTGYRKPVRVEAEPIADNSEALAEKAVEAARSGARVLVIRNTVTDCVATLRAVERCTGSDAPSLFRVGAVTAPHHSRYAAPDRKALDAAIEDAFGKHAGAGGCLAIATQTVEQSLDVDADLMLTDLCPADVLLQRIGRLHRHAGRTRPGGFEQPRVVVLVPPERSLQALLRRDGEPAGSRGLGTVYEDMRILEATWRLLEEYRVWTIPDMNRELVERATHPDALSCIGEELGGRWPQHQQWVLGSALAGRVYARGVLIDYEKPFGSELFPRDPDKKITTRLGAEDRSVEFEQSITGPFGRSFRRINVPQWYAPDAPADAAAQEVCCTEAGVTFAFAGKPFIYNRYGVHPADAEYLKGEQNA